MLPALGLLNKNELVRIQCSFLQFKPNDTQRFCLYPDSGTHIFPMGPGGTVFNL